MEKNDIIIIHGTDYKNMAKRVLEQAVWRQTSVI